MLLPAQHCKKPSIGLTPLIDIVFILLIFFMLIVQFKQFQPLPLSLAAATTKKQPEPPTFVQIKLVAPNVCRGQLNEDSCEKIIQSVVRQPKKNIQVLLSYSADSTLQDILAVHRRLVGLGFTTHLLTSNDGDRARVGAVW